MARKKPCEYYWALVKSDCEDLLGRFQQTESVRFEEFSAIWRELDFSSMFSGFHTCHERKSFTRLIASIAYKYILPPYSFQIRVGALYLIYGIYNMQLSLPKEKIRIALKDWYDVQRLVTDAKGCQHLDVVYIFKKLLSAKAFCFTAMPKKLTFETSERVQHNVNEDFRACRDRVAELASSEMLEEIINVHGHYERMKKSSLPTSSGVTLLNLADSIWKCGVEYQQWKDKITAAKEKDSKKMETTQKSESSSRADMLAAIKSKSYSHPSKRMKSRRHRQTGMVTLDSVADQTLVKKGKPPSLKARTCQNFGKPGKPQPTKEWLLSVVEKDKDALKRSTEQKRFKW